MEKHARKVAARWTSVAVLALCAMATGIAQSPAGEEGHGGQATRQQPARGDGIKVHGHWTIDVRNPDGALASHNEFENALEPTGAAALAALFSKGPLEAWRLDLIGASGGPCATVATSTTTNASSLVIGLPTLAQNSQTGTWTSTGSLTPGAPYFSFGAISAFQGIDPNVRFFPPGRVIDDAGDVFTSTFTPPVPWLTFNAGAAQGTLELDPAVLGPGSYSTSVVLTDTGGNSNLYQVLLTILPSQTQTVPGTPVPCSVVEPGAVITSDFANAWFATLATQQVSVAPSSMTFQITGNVMASSNEPIVQVRSRMAIAPSSGSFFDFSARTLATPIQIITGQQIFVKVVFSFS